MMVKAWAASVLPLTDKTLYQAYYAALPKWRKEKADQCRQEADKILSVAAWSLWEYARSQEAALPEHAVYNLSHSGTYVMCAYSDSADAKVGCDIEKLGKNRMSLAKRFFCESEYRQIAEAATEEDSRQLLYRYWVLKESFLKATRMGLSLGMNAFEIGWKAGRPVLLNKPDQFPESYYYQEYTTEGFDAKLAVCSTDEEIDEVLHLHNFHHFEVQIY